MKLFWILFSLAAGIFLIVLLTAFICFHIAFYVPRKKHVPVPEFDLPPGEVYEPYHDTMIRWIKEVRAMPCEAVSIRSFDGLRLTGKLYTFSPDAPIELMLHGYRGSAERDLCGGVQRSFALGRSVLIVDQRGCGSSEGNVITFGVNESRDCHAWLDYLVSRFGTERKIILTGISMGAATVLIAAGQQLPKNVIGVLADCGYTSARDIIKAVITQMRLPANAAYPFVKLGARVFGGFSLEERSPVEAVQKCQVPVIFFHGETDDYVPCPMSQENFNACASKKRIVTIPGAGHGMCYLVDPDGYLKSLWDFFGPDASAPGFSFQR